MPWDDELDPLSEAYGIAASHSDRIRVVAGPGTGKSFALKRRVARLLEQNVPPGQILPVTFTRVAAEDLHRELVSLNVEGADSLRGRTLHSLGMWILMRQLVLESTGRVPRPLNQFELEPLYYDLPATFGSKTERKKRIKAYEAAWARLQHDEPGFAQDNEDIEFERALLAWLRFHESMLIGEIIPELYVYLRDNPAAPEANLFRHILVDEFPDLNKAEQRVIEMLGEQHSLCIVGDDDQSIYSFKHAHPEGIREWNTVHEGVDDLILQECRRCPVQVTRMANALISRNEDREPRELEIMSDNGDGIVDIIQYQYLEDEVRGVSELVLDLVNNQNVPAGDILVLAQRRVIGNPIYEILSDAAVPAKSYYQESELDSQSSQERLSIFKLVENLEDRVALRWLLGLGSSNFRTNAYQRVREHCEFSGLSPWNALSALSAGDISIPYTRSLVERFREIANELAVLSQVSDLNEFIDHWLPDGMGGVEQLREIAIEAVDECEDRSDLLREIVDQITQPEIPLEVEETRIMSLHRSKGLSSPVVIIAGCVEGLLPSRPPAGLPIDNQRAIIEEQRRLFFVGITRVKAQPQAGKPGHLYLTSSRIWPQADALGSGASPAAIRRGNAYFNASRFLGELGTSTPRSVRG